MALTLTELLVSHSTDCLLELPSQLETVVRARMSALVRGEVFLLSFFANLLVNIKKSKIIIVK
jgi:hypothetical protein